MSEKALFDLKVIDLTQHVAGPLCTKYLADYGADIVKVEPNGGDPARRMRPFFHDEAGIEKSGLFLYLNSNKRGVTLNVESAAGSKLLRELARDADVLIESFAPGEAVSLGLSYEALRQINSRLVVTSISAFGNRGPYRAFKATDLTATAWAGTLANMGDDGREPIRMGGRQAEMMTGRIAAIATVAAVLEQEASGMGQHIDLSMQEAVASYDLGSVTGYSWSGAAKRARGRGFSTGASTGLFPCRDGYVHVFPYIGGLPRMANLIGRPELASHPWFVNHNLRAEHAKEFDDEFMTPWFSQHGRHEIVERAQALGMPFSTVVGIDELLEEPQLKHRDFFADVEHPATGKLRYPGAPFRMSETPWQAGRAPLLGEHNEEVYCGRLGYSREDLGRMRALGAI